jgi:cyclase
VLTKRLIACFDVVAGRVTKAQQFQDNIDVAPATDLARQLYEDQIDEIVFYDITASAQQRKIDLETVRGVAEHVFVPFTVGGGIRSIDDMFEVLKAGAEKISIDSMAVREPDIIRQGAEAFGRQCIVLSTQVKRVEATTSIPSGYEVFIDGARVATGMDALEWVQRGEELGAGEIVVNSIDRDGTASGYDLDITSAVASVVNVPVIASGGAGTPDHIAAGLTDGGASAAIISSILYSPRLDRNLGVRELKDAPMHARPRPIHAPVCGEIHLAHARIEAAGGLGGTARLCQRSQCSHAYHRNSRSERDALGH